MVPNLGSMDPLVVHRRYQGVYRIRNFVLRLIGGGPQNIGTLILGVHSQKRLKIAGLVNSTMATASIYEVYTQKFDELKKQIEKNRNTRETSAHNGKVHSVAWNCDGRRIASGSVDKTVSVLSLEHDKLRNESNYKGHTDSVDQVCWHPSHPDQLVTASVDKTVRIWDVRSSKCSHVIHTKGDNLNLCWSPDGATIGVGNKDDLITFIDTNSYKIKIEEQFKVFSHVKAKIDSLNR